MVTRNAPNHLVIRPCIDPFLNLVKGSKGMQPTLARLSTAQAVPASSCFVWPA